MEPAVSIYPGSRHPLHLYDQAKNFFFLTKLIVKDGSGDPETSPCYAAIGLDCWVTSHDALLLTLISFTLHVHITLSLSLACVSLSQQVSLVWVMEVIVPFSCPLNPQPIKADGCPPWVWLCQKFLPVKREFSVFTVALCMLRTGDWIKIKFWCNLLVSLAFYHFFGSEWIGLIWNLFNLIWLDCDCVKTIWTLTGLN